MICTLSHDKRKLELDVDDHLQCQYFHHKYLTNRCKKKKKKTMLYFYEKVVNVAWQRQIFQRYQLRRINAECMRVRFPIFCWYHICLYGKIYMYHYTNVIAERVIHANKRLTTYLTAGLINNELAYKNDPNTYNWFIIVVKKNSARKNTILKTLL